MVTIVINRPEDLDKQLESIKELLYNELMKGKAVLFATDYGNGSFRSPSRQKPYFTTPSIAISKEAFKEEYLPFGTEDTHFFIITSDISKINDRLLKDEDYELQRDYYQEIKNYLGLYYHKGDIITPEELIIELSIPADEVFSVLRTMVNRGLLVLNVLNRNYYLLEEIRGV